MSAKKRQRPVAVGEAVEGYLARSGLARRLAQAQVIPDWPRLVGPQIAAVTDPASVTPDGILFGRVRTSPWMNELQLMSPGIPVDTHKTEKKPGVEVALTVLHAGGKFVKATYKVSGGLHGVGVSVVNALSEKLEVWVDRDGKRHHMAFERGDTKEKLTVVGKAKGTGTTVTFKPDTKIFTETRFDYATLANRLRELAFLNKGLTITLKDERTGSQKEETYIYKGGLAEFVKWVTGSRRTLHQKPIAFEATREGTEVEGAILYDDQYSENTFTFVNNINTHEGGTHLTGFKSALTRTINEWAKKDGLPKKEE